MSEAKVVNEVLRNYYNISDQKVNISKSHVIFCTGVAHRDYIKIKRELQITQVHCPFQYLGVNIGMKCLPMSAFNPMLERIRNKLSSWKAKDLPFPGKVTLVQAVIQSISVYLLSTYGYQRLLNKIEFTVVVFFGVRMVTEEIYHLYHGSRCVKAGERLGWVLDS